MPSTHLFEHNTDARSVPAGTVIFEAGDKRDFMYAVVVGEVDLFVNGRHVETVGPGGIFGEMALIDKEARTGRAVARTDAKVVEVDERRFLFLVQQTPNFAIHLMRVLSDRLRRMDRRIGQQA
jgi:CRP/FNR family transcriptional regulator, cyclic AMP receptor protein